MRWLSVPPDTMRKPSSAQPVGEGLGVAHDLRRVVAELGPGGLVERHGLRRDHVHERAALQAGEHGLVDRGGVLLAAQDRAGARAAQGLVRGERDDVGVGHRRRVRAAGDEPGDVRGVDHQQRADVVGDRAERGEVDDARVRRGTGDDQLRSLGDVRPRGSRRSRGTSVSSSTPYATNW